MDDFKGRMTGHAAPFLAYLLTCDIDAAKAAPVTFQTFDDEKPGGKGRPELARVLHGSLREHHVELERLNEAWWTGFWSARD